MFFCSGLAFIAGIFVLQQLSSLPDIAWVLLLLPLLLSYLFIPYSRIPCGFGMGFLWALLWASIRLSTALPVEFIGKDILVEGFIDSIPVQQERSVRFEFRVTEQLQASDTQIPLPMTVRLNWYNYGGAVIPNLQVGERWQLRLRLKSPHGYMNPGGFDYETWLFTRNIRAVGYVREDKANLRLDQHFSLLYKLAQLRHTLLLNLQQSLQDTSNSGVITALALGHRAQLDTETWELLLATGTNHLIAISGLHIGFVAGLAYLFIMKLGGWVLCRYAVLKPIWPLQRIAALAALMIALFYSALAGFALPTQRALIMLGVASLSVLIYRKISPSSSLLLALLAVLLIDPFAIVQPSLWLSFGAVVILVYLFAGRVQLPKNLPDKFFQWGKVQIILTLALVPFTLFWFGRAALVAAIANSIAVPVVGFIFVPTIFVSTLLNTISPVLASGLFYVVDLGFSYLWPVLEQLASLPLNDWLQYQPSFWQAVMALIGMMIIAAPAALPNRWVGIIWMLPLFLHKPLRPTDGELWLTILDVGQGTAVVAQTENHFLVYDTGPKFNDRFDAGKAVLLPYMRNKALRKIDTVVISHGDNDHIGGAKSLLKATPAKRVLTSAPEKLSEFDAESCHAGQTWHWDGVEFTIMHPKSQSNLRGNNASCVLRIATKHNKVLLTGDIEKAAEWRLAAANMLQPADLIIVPHHGSRTSSTNIFLQRVKPQFAVFTVGHRNRYGFPKADIVERYRKVGSSIWLSSASGALWFTLGASGVRLEESFRDSAARYWHNRPLIKF